MNVQPNVHTGLTPPLHLAHPPHPAPNQIPESELPPGCETGFVVNIPEDIQQHTPECGETTALLGLIRDKGLTHILLLTLKKAQQEKKHWICLVYSMLLRWH